VFALGHQNLSSGPAHPASLMPTAGPGPCASMASASPASMASATEGKARGRCIFYRRGEGDLRERERERTGYVG
jgi:hypothetical protein